MQYGIIMLILIFVQFVTAILVFIVQGNVVSLHKFEDYKLIMLLPYVHAIEAVHFLHFLSHCGCTFSNPLRLVYFLW